MNLPSATGDAPDVHCSEQIDPKLLLRIQSNAAVCPAQRSKPHLVAPLVFGYGVLLLTALGLYWSEATSYRRLQVRCSEQETRIQSLLTENSSANGKSEIASLRRDTWEGVLYPALVGATVWGVSPDDLFQFDGGREALEKLIPDKPSEDVYEQVAIARAYAITKQSLAATKALQHAESQTKEPRVLKLIEAEKLALTAR